jgi:hypothetical protein
MKIKLCLSVIILTLMITFSSCVQHITTETVLHKDGAIERTILFTDADSSKALSNIFGVSKDNGWALDVKESEKREKDGKPNYDIRFSKKFASIEDANKEMNPEGNSEVFKIRSDLEKRFRWFYTYYDYSDTYISLDRLDSVKQEDYFTPEDYAFIDRLPAEGKPIARNDKFFLDKLNERIVDNYLTTELKVRLTDCIRSSISNNTADTSWISGAYSTLPDIVDRKLKSDDEFLPESVLIEFIHAVKLPLDTAKVLADFRERYKVIDSKLQFVQEAGTGEYRHIIRLPWPVVSSNADSVNGSALVWQPPTIKLYLKDYKMKATGRELNLLPVGASVLMIGFTIYLFVRKRRPAYS